MSEIFGCEITLGTYASGKVSITLGPIEPGDVVDLLRFIGSSDDFGEMILERIAAQLTEHVMMELDDD